MSRQKTRKRHTSQSESAQATVPPQAADALPNTPPSPAIRKALTAAVALTILWYTALLTVAAISANPVTLNLDQLQTADYVVQATVIHVGQGTVRVTNEWKRGQSLGNIIVENLAETSARPGRQYVLPLTRIGGDRYRVPPANLPDGPPLIYPDSEETHAQLLELYGDAK